MSLTPVLSPCQERIFEILRATPSITIRMDPSREWGRTMQMSADVTARMEQVWQALGL